MRTHEESLRAEQCRRIMLALDSGQKSLDELVKLTKLTLGSVIKHLDVLELAGRVEVNRSDLFAAKR